MAQIDNDRNVSQNRLGSDHHLARIYISGAKKILTIVTEQCGKVDAHRLISFADKHEMFSFEPKIKSARSILRMIKVIAKRLVTNQDARFQPRSGDPRKNRFNNQKQQDGGKEGKVHNTTGLDETNDSETDLEHCVRDKTQWEHDKANEQQHTINAAQKLIVKDHCREWLKHGTCKGKNTPATDCSKKHDEGLKGYGGRRVCADFEKHGQCRFKETCIFRHDEDAANHLTTHEDNMIGQDEGASANFMTAVDPDGVDFSALCEADVSSLAEQIYNSYKAQTGGDGNSNHLTVLDSFSSHMTIHGTGSDYMEDTTSSFLIDDEGTGKGVDGVFRIFGSTRVLQDAVAFTTTVECKDGVYTYIWLVDSGANLPTIPSIDEAHVLAPAKDKLSFATTNGATTKSSAIVDVPGGIAQAAIVPGAPRIAPMCLLQRKYHISWPKGGKFEIYDPVGQQYLDTFERHGIPYIRVSYTKEQAVNTVSMMLLQPAEMSFYGLPSGEAPDLGINMAIVLTAFDDFCMRALNDMGIKEVTTTREALMIICKLHSDGMTWTRIAQEINIHTTTLYRWRQAENCSVNIGNMAMARINKCTMTDEMDLVLDGDVDGRDDSAYAHIPDDILFSDVFSDDDVELQSNADIQYVEDRAVIDLTDEGESTNLTTQGGHAVTLQTGRTGHANCLFIRWFIWITVIITCWVPGYSQQNIQPATSGDHIARNNTGTIEDQPGIEVFDHFLKCGFVLEGNIDQSPLSRDAVAALRKVDLRSCFWSDLSVQQQQACREAICIIGDIDVAEDAGHECIAMSRSLNGFDDPVLLHIDDSGKVYPPSSIPDEPCWTLFCINATKYVDLNQTIQDAAVCLTAAAKVDKIIVGTSEEYCNSHAAKHHRPFDPRCRICVEGRLRAQPHKRIASVPCGTISADTCMLGQADELILICVHRADPKLLVSMPLTNKSQEVVKNALLKAIRIFEHVFGVPPLRRMHCDRESAVRAESTIDTLASKHITCTFSSGFDHGNGAAESAISRLTDDARVRLVRFRDRVTRRRLFKYAVANSCDVRNIEALTKADMPASISAEGILPFGSLCLARIAPSVKLSGVDMRGVRAIYLSIDYTTPKSVWVGLLSEGDSIITNVVPALRVKQVEEHGKPIFPQCRFLPTLADQRFVEVSWMNCGTCQKKRPVRTHDVTRLTARGLTCQCLAGLTCAVPLHGDDHPPIPIRRGAPRGPRAHVSRTLNVLPVDQSHPDFCSAGDAIDELHSFQQTGYHEPWDHSSIWPLGIQRDDERDADPSGVDSDSFDEGELEAHLTRSIYKCHVTRNCTATEKQDQRCLTARGTEVGRVCDFGTLGDPPEITEYEDAVQQAQERQKDGTLPPDTISRTLLLDSIKFAEMSKESWTFKARLVVRGDLVMFLLTQVLVKIWPEIVAPVCSLGALRCVLAWSLIAGGKVRNYDVRNAYLHIVFDEKTYGKHWLILSPAAIAALPDAWRTRAQAMRRPLFPMRRCLYGHPMAGGLYIAETIRLLKAHSYRQSLHDPALFFRNGGVFAVYSDDNSASGPEEELDRFEEILKSRFLVDECGVDARILGMQPVRRETPEGRSLLIDMGDYCKSIVKTYQDATNCSIRCVASPGSEDLRDRSSDVSPRDIKGGKRAQSILPMCLWLARCSRFDVAVATCLLCSCVSTWSDRCETQLRRLLGYILFSVNLHLRMFLDCRDFDKIGNMRVLLYSDADLGVPRSLSGSMLGLAGHPDFNSWIPLSFFSKSQPISADSTPLAELIACVQSLKAHVVLGHEIWEHMLRQPPAPVPTLVDNAALLRIAHHGASTPLAAMSKALGLRLSLLRDLQAAQVAVLVYCPSGINRASIMTKLLAPLLCARERAFCGIGCDSDDAGPQVNLTLCFSDIWQVCAVATVRVHRTPRRRLFVPSTSCMREGNLSEVGDVRVTVIQPVPESGITAYQLIHQWRRFPAAGKRLDFQWTGLSIFFPRVGPDGFRFPEKAFSDSLYPLPVSPS